MCSSENDDIILIKSLSHCYGSRMALQGITIKIKKGITTGLLGQNGAGKSTLLKIIAGIIPKKTGYKIRPKSIGYLPEVPALYDEMNVIKLVTHIGRLNNLRKAQIKELLKKEIDNFGLTEVQNVKCSKLSKGYKQRVGLLLAFMHRPEVVILDEPTAGLDPKQSEATRAIISRMANDCTVILSSHNLKEAQELCGQIIILDHGKVIESGTKDELSKKIIGFTRIKAKLQTREENNDQLLDSTRKLINQIEGLKEIEELTLQSPNVINTSFTIANSKKSLSPSGYNNITTNTDNESHRKDIPISTIFTDGDFIIKSFTENEASIDEIFMTLINRK